MQDLEVLRRKLLKALLILRSNKDVGRRLCTHVGKHRRKLPQSTITTSLEALDGHVASLQTHIRTVEYLLERLGGTERLVACDPVAQRRL